MNAVFEFKKAKNNRFSIRQWALLLGYKNPSYLFSVLKGHRKINGAFADKLCEYLKFDNNQKEYLEAIVLMGAKSIGKSSMLMKEYRNSLKKLKGIKNLL